MPKRGNQFAVIILVGLIFTTIGVYVTYDRISFLDKSLAAKATVVDNFCTYSSIGHTYDYYPVFQFVNSRTGQNVTAQGVIGNGGAPAYLVGQEVDVLYNPENPSVGVISGSILDHWLPSIIALPIGIGLTAAGILGVVRKKTSAPATPNHHINKL